MKSFVKTVTGFDFSKITNFYYVISLIAEFLYKYKSCTFLVFMEHSFSCFLITAPRTVQKQLFHWVEGCFHRFWTQVIGMTIQSNGVFMRTAYFTWKG